MCQNQKQIVELPFLIPFCRRYFRIPEGIHGIHGAPSSREMLDREIQPHAFRLKHGPHVLHDAPSQQCAMIYVRACSACAMMTHIRAGSASWTMTQCMHLYSCGAKAQIHNPHAPLAFFSFATASAQSCAASSVHPRSRHM